LKQQEYFLFSVCLIEFSLAILTTLYGVPLLGALFTAYGMWVLVGFLDVWLEPEKWKQKQ
jgi:Zn-dependent protease